MRWLFKLTTTDYTDQEIDEPIGWREAQFTIKRDIEKYHGLFFGYVTQLEFIGNGFRILRSQFDQFGADGVAKLNIFLDCGSGFTLVFSGTLDFTTYASVHNSGCSCTIDVTGSDIEVLTVNRQEIDTDMMASRSIDGFDITGNSFFDLLMHNYTFNYYGDFLARTGVESHVITQTDGSPPKIVAEQSYFVQVHVPICINIDEIGGLQECQFGGDVYNESSLPPSETFADIAAIFIAPRSDVYYFDYSFIGSIFENSSQSRTASQSFFFGKRQLDGTQSIVETILSIGGYARGGSFVLNLPMNKQSTFSVSLAMGEKIYLACRFVNYTLTTGSGLYECTFQINLNEGCFIKIKEVSTFASTEARSAKLYDAFWKILANYTGSKDAFYSLLLGYTSAPDRAYVSNGCASYTALLNGYMVRGFPSKPLLVNLKDLFDSVDAIYNIGLGFEVQSDNVIRCRVEEKGYFYSLDTLLAIYTDVQEIKTSIDPKLAFNTFQLGFNDYQVEEGTDKLNTNDEFITQFNWSSVSKNIKQSFSRLSKYVASLYIIEYTRRNRYTSTATQQSKYDAYNFLIAMNRAGLPQAEKNERFANVSGLQNWTEAYNLRFNLFSTLLRWSNIINSSISRLPSKVLKFTSGMLNYHVQMQYSDQESCDGNYSDKSFFTNNDLSINDENNQNAEPIFEPIVYEFDYPLSFAEFNRFKRYPQGTVIFGRDLENLTQGFILEVNYRPNEGIASFKIIRSYKQNVAEFFPPVMNDVDFMKGFTVLYDGTLSIWGTDGIGTGIYSDWAIADGRNGTLDYRSRAVMCYDSRNALFNAIGNTTGVDKVKLTGNQSGQKAFSLSFVLKKDQVEDGGGPDVYAPIQNSGSSPDTFTLSLPDSDASEAHENLPPVIVSMYVTKIR